MPARLRIGQPRASSLARFIGVYNRRCPHSSLDRKVSDEFYFPSLRAMKKVAWAMIAVRITGYAPLAGFRFVASDRTGRPCVTLRSAHFDVSQPQRIHLSVSDGCSNE
jgi:hypothetical protein